MDNKLSSIIKHKLPAFVRDEHEMFVAFIQSYVEFLEEEGNWGHYMNRFQRNLDVDRADDDFVARYVSEFASTFPQATKIPTNQLVKLMREFYLAKGSEDSFRFIFTILFGVDIEIIYPREYMYIPSSGEYNSDDVVYITGDNWFKLNIDNNDLNAAIEGTTSGAVAVIDTITSTYLGGKQISKLDISSYEGQFIPGESVVLSVDETEVIETVRGAIIRMKVVDGGTNYKLTDPITITDTGTGQRAKAKILKLEKGGLTQSNVVSGGSGYAVGDPVKAGSQVDSPGFGFRGHVYEVSQSGEIIRIRIDAPGYDYTIKTYAMVKSPTGMGAVVELNGDNVGKIESVQMIDGGINYDQVNTIVINIDTEEGINSTLVPVLGGIFTSPKRYTNEKSTPSGNSKIMDSYYYQQYSYVIGSSVSPHNWLGIVKRIAHPAGTQLFGMYKLENEIDISVDVAPDDGTSTFQRTYALTSFSDTDIELTVEQYRIIERHVNATCQLGMVLSELNHIKFLDTFDWTLGDFANMTIDDIENECPDLSSKQESSEITLS